MPGTEALMFRVLRRALVPSAFKRNALLPLPSPAVEPSGTGPLPELMERLDRAHAMCLAVEGVRGSGSHWSHSVFGLLNAAQILILMLAEVHVAYHARQMGRVIQKEG